MNLRTGALASLLAAVAVLASGCHLQLRAVQLKVEVDDQGMRIVKPADGRYHGGETVITIENATEQKRQFTLAQTSASPNKLPRGILDGYSYRDDGAIVGVTGVMRPEAIVLQFLSIPTPTPTKTTLHIYLRSDTPYLLFDRLGGFRHGYALRLEAH